MPRTLWNKITLKFQVHSAIIGHKRREFNPWVGKIPWRRAWQPPPVFLPGESHGQRSLEGFSPQGHKELGHD